jgi:hypothetical protein
MNDFRLYPLLSKSVRETERYNYVKANLCLEWPTQQFSASERLDIIFCFGKQLRQTVKDTVDTI